MALGEWLSVTNARELARTQIAKEADELEHTPDAERHELALIYQSKGLGAAEARRSAAQIMKANSDRHGGGRVYVRCWQAAGRVDVLRSTYPGPAAFACYVSLC